MNTFEELSTLSPEQILSFAHQQLDLGNQKMDRDVALVLIAALARRIIDLEKNTIKSQYDHLD